MTFNTGNPIGSTDARDRSDNSENLDLAVNSLSQTFVDRLGVTRDTLEGIYQKSAYYRAGTFDAGYTLTNNRQTLAYGNIEYSWSGAFPKVVAAGATPATSGGIGAGSWVDRTDVVLRDELASSSGSGLVGFQQDGAGSVSRTSQDKMRERVTPLDFDAHADGVTLDDTAFAQLEITYLGMEIDCLGKQYAVTTQPVGNKYYNGDWVIGGRVSRMRYQGAQLTGAGRIVFGDEALATMSPAYSMGSSGSLVAVGYRAMNKMEQAKTSVAIGSYAMGNTIITRDNYAIGDSALKNIQSRTPGYSQTLRQGTRNIAIGGNAAYFAIDCYGIVAIGRNTAHCVEGGDGLVAIGGGAAGGYAPIGLSGEIENGAPWGVDGTTIKTVAIGTEAAATNLAYSNVAVGGEALKEVKKSDNIVAVGARALTSLDAGTGYNGGLNVVVDIAGTYSHVGNVLTLTFAASGVAVGDKVQIRLLDGGSQTFAGDIAIATVVTVIDANAFTVNHPISRTASGTAHLYGYETAVQQARNENIVAVGSNAGSALLTGGSTTLVGTYSLVAATKATRTTTVGYFAGQAALTSSASVVVGSFALNNALELSQATAVGDSALRNKIDGSTLTETFINITGLGYDSRVSGANQVQLGNSAATTYVYGTVQNRSDARDKADVRDTALGIEFIMGLRPVDGRWDMRDDYMEEYQVQVGIDPNTAEPIFETRLRNLPKDGSKARARKHHWFIAQEVKELCDKLGVEFGGYQDHSVSGGCDVLSLGYDEFIPPAIKAIQQCWTRLDELDKRIANLEHL